MGDERTKMPLMPLVQTLTSVLVMSGFLLALHWWRGTPMSQAEITWAVAFLALWRTFKLKPA